MEKDKNISDRFVVYCVQRPDPIKENVWNTNVFINGIYKGSIRKVGSALKSGIYNLTKVKDPRDIIGKKDGTKIVLSADINKAGTADGYILDTEDITHTNELMSYEKQAQDTAKNVAKCMSSEAFSKSKKRILWIETMKM